MAWQVTNLPNLLPTSSGSVNTNGVGSLDDAEVITIFLSTLSTTVSASIQVSQFDPAIAAPGGVTQSTQWYNFTNNPSTGTVVITSGALTIADIGFRGLRLVTSGGDAAGVIVAFATKQIFV